MIVTGCSRTHFSVHTPFGIPAFMILEPVTETVITGVKEEPLDLKALRALPGIAGYIVQEGDSLWDIAKKFHTTMGNIITTNELPGEQIKAGQRLLLVKEVGV